MTAPTDVAIYIPSLNGGGAERVMVTLANAFAARGLKVDLVVVSANGTYRSEVSSDVRVVDLGVSRVASSLGNLARYMGTARPRALLSALRHANIIAIWARMLSGAPTRLVVSERNSLSGLRAAGGIGWADKVMLLLMCLFYPRADHVVAVSRGIADELVDICGLRARSVSAIYNPLDLETVRHLSELPLEAELPNDGRPLIVAVGRLTPQKDFDTLIRAFARLCAVRPSRLVILGDGKDREDLARLAAALGLRDFVTFAGFLTNPFPWLKHARLFVLSSRYEGLPNVMLQAMACGTAVVSTDCPTGPSEILEDGRWGRLVAVGDIDALALAMADAIDDPSPPPVADRARDFAIDAIVDRYASVLDLGGAR